jgi:uncharacterized membrane protein YjdF
MSDFYFSPPAILIIVSKGLWKVKKYLSMSVNYCLLFLWMVFVLIDDFGLCDVAGYIFDLSLIHICGDVFNFGFVNVFGDIDTLFDDGGLSYMVKPD